MNKNLRIIVVQSYSQIQEETQLIKRLVTTIIGTPRLRTE